MLAQFEQELRQALGRSLQLYCQELERDEFTSPKDKARKLQGQAMHEVQALKQLCLDGSRHVFEAVHALSLLDRSIDFAAFKDNLEQAFAKLNSHQAIENYSRQIVSGSSWSTVLDITDATLELLYKGGQSLFAMSRYADAESSFTFLTIVDSLQYSFWIGLGHARFHLGKQIQAVNAYQMASLCDPFALWPYFYSANCYEALSLFDQALICLEDAEECYKKQPMPEKEMKEVIAQRIAAVKQR